MSLSKDDSNGVGVLALISIKPVMHYNDVVAGIYFKYNPEINSLIKKIKGVRFSRSCSCWIVAYRDDLPGDFASVMKGLAKVEITYPDKGEEIRKCPTAFRELMIRKRYSGATIKNYESQLEFFLSYFPKVGAAELTDLHVKEYIHYLIETRRVSASTQNVVINAIKFYFEHVLGRDRRVYAFERPVRETKLPTVMSEEEVVAVLKACENMKHRNMLFLIYASGLRRSELINMKIADIDIGRRCIYVRGGKGKKDRMTLLSKKVEVMLQDYLEAYRPKVWLFEGLDGGPYSESSLQKVFASAVKKSKIRKAVTLHSLRHTFATNLLENGTDLRYIQSLLGHSSSRTTEIYAHVTKKGFEKIRSPLDNLDL